MGKEKRYIKEETVKRIKTLLKKYKSVDNVLKSEDYQKLQNYMNGFEKANAVAMVKHCKENYTFEEIKFMIEGDTKMAAKKNTKTVSKKEDTHKKDNKNESKENDPVTEEAIFIISQQKVVETNEPVEVIIGEEPKTQNVQVDAVDVEFTEVDDGHDDNHEPVILGDIVKHKKSSKVKNENDETEEEGEEEENILVKVLNDAFTGLTNVVKDAVDAANKYADNWEKEMEEIERKAREEYEAACKREEEEARKKEEEAVAQPA